MVHRRRRLLLIALSPLAALTWCYCATGRPLPQGQRPVTWARPVSLAGVPNLHRVDRDLYRSAQPTAAGMANLARLGIRTVVNLRSFHSDREEMGDLPLRRERITMKAWHPERKGAVRFLRILADPANRPVLVHCQHGADRTGTMCALYRIAIQGWPREEAIREMVRGGYGYHRIWSNLPAWLRRLDVDQVLQEARTP